MSAYYGDPESERVFIYDNKDAAEYIRADLVPQWQPIETAPKDGTDILVHTDSVVRLAFWDHDFDDWDGGRSGQIDSPTHWHPLPIPPPAT